MEGRAHGGEEEAKATRVSGLSPVDPRRPKDLWEAYTKTAKLGCGFEKKINVVQCPAMGTRLTELELV